ncbi:MAG: efflux RND transporter periplasmic adaptor subunit [Rhodospirillales bacterium]|nr:efflux RND transporter periplasmic adaptor subunit [Rhodospirillales bacterium]
MHARAILILLSLLSALPTAARAQSGVPVLAATAKRQDVPVVLRNIGAVQAFYSVLVRARVDGTLDRVFFTEGQEVRAGDAIALIDPRPYEAALAAAVAKKAADQAQLANAHADLTRYSNLARSDFASRQQVDTQQATVAELQATIAGDDAAIETARLNVEFCHITSPISGRTGLRLVDPGNLIHATDAQGIVTITQLHPIAVIFTLPQDDLPQIQAAMAQGSAPVLAFSGDDRTELAHGRLMTIDNQIDQSTGTVRLKAEFANPDNKLWPGLFVNAHLQAAILKDVVTVPSPALQRGPNGLYVYLVKSDQTVAMQPVKVTQDDGTLAVIADGVAPGAEVVVNGQLRLQNGSHVAVAKASS